MESALAEVVGKSRTIPLYSQVTDTGNTAQFTIVGFAGIRIVEFDLNGKNKHITIQPAVVVDETAISEGSSTSYHIYKPVMLAR
jgi:hypothetical protein